MRLKKCVLSFLRKLVRDEIRNKDESKTINNVAERHRLGEYEC